jgi:hemerythrin-like domain-containing protein
MVAELLAIHSHFRSELAAMLRLTQDLLAGRQPLDGAQTRARVQALIRASYQYTYMLHAHHGIETAQLFPALAAQGLEASVVTRLNRDHADIGALVDQFNADLHDLSAAQPAVLDTDLQRLAQALTAHLAYEETHVCPLLANLTGWFR